VADETLSVMMQVANSQGRGCRLCNQHWAIFPSPNGSTTYCQVSMAMVGIQPKPVKFRAVDVGVLEDVYV